MLTSREEFFSGIFRRDGRRDAQQIRATGISYLVLDVGGVPGAPPCADLGGQAWLHIDIVDTFEGLDSLTISLESDTSPSLDASPTAHLSSTFTPEALVSGLAPMRVGLPIGCYQRYLGMRYTVGGSNPTQGSILAFLVLHEEAIAGFEPAFALDR